MNRRRFGIFLAAVAAIALTPVAWAFFVNPTSISPSADIGVLVKCSSTAASIALDVNRYHTVWNTGYDQTGSASTETVYLANNATPVTDLNEGSNKFPLFPGTSVDLKPGITTLQLKCSGSGTPIVSISQGIERVGVR